MLKNVSRPIKTCLKYFMTPIKTLRTPAPQPFYILNVGSLKPFPKYFETFFTFWYSFYSSLVQRN